MKTRTELERLEIYKKVRKILEKRNSMIDGFCLALNYATEWNPDIVNDKSLLKIEYPEIYALKPSEVENSSYWWKNGDTGFDVRIEKITEVINQMQKYLKP